MWIRVSQRRRPRSSVYCHRGKKAGNIHFEKLNQRMKTLFFKILKLINWLSNSWRWIQTWSDVSRFVFGCISTRPHHAVYAPLVLHNMKHHHQDSSSLFSSRYLESFDIKNLFGPKSIRRTKRGSQVFLHPDTFY